MPWGAAPPQPPTTKTDACANRYSRRSVLLNARADPRRPLATQALSPPTTTHTGRLPHCAKPLMPCRPLVSHQKPYHGACICTPQTLRQGEARSRYGSRRERGQRARTKRRPPPHVAARQARRPTTTACDSNAVPLPTTHIGRLPHYAKPLMPCRPLVSYQKPYHGACICTPQNLRQGEARSRYALSRHRCCHCGCHRRRHRRRRCRCRRSAAAVTAATVAAAKPLSLTSPSSPLSPPSLSRRCWRRPCA